MVHLVRIYKMIVEWRRNCISNDNPEFQVLDLRDLFQEITESRRSSFLKREFKFLRNDLYISSGGQRRVIRESDGGLRDVEPTPTVACLTEKLGVMFPVPTHSSSLRFSRSRNIEAFLCFLAELLYQKTDPADFRVEILEKKVRCLLTILGDISWSFLNSDDQHPKYQELLGDLKLRRIEREGSDETGDDPVAEVKDEITLLHEGLLLLNSSTNDLRSASAIEELKLPLMRAGDIVRQAEYLISAFLVKDAPLTYVTTRLTHLNKQIQRIGRKIQKYTHRYNLGGSTVTMHFNAQGERENDIIIGLEEKEREILDQLVGGATSL